MSFKVTGNGSSQQSTWSHSHTASPVIFLKSNNLSLNEAIDMAQNSPLWRLMSTFGATYS